MHQGAKKVYIKDSITASLPELVEIRETTFFSFFGVVDDIWGRLIIYLSHKHKISDTILKILLLESQTGQTFRIFNCFSHSIQNRIWEVCC